MNDNFPVISTQGLESQREFTLNPRFWAAVEDCLVSFHQINRSEAAEKVNSLGRGLTAYSDEKLRFSGMIYHAEAWQIACNLASHDLPIGQHQKEYDALLAQHGLFAG